MLRQRRQDGTAEKLQEGIFIGEPETRKGPNEATKEPRRSNGWRNITFLLALISGCLLIFCWSQGKELSNCFIHNRDLNETLRNTLAELEADRLSVGECRAEMDTIEVHLTTSEKEKETLRREVDKLTATVMQQAKANVQEHEELAQAQAHQNGQENVQAGQEGEAN